MPSLRQKVTTYFRQLSFIAEPRDGPRSPRKAEADDDGNFITKYLEGRMQRIFEPGPEIYNGQNPTDLPDLKIGHYATGQLSITAACTGPDEGLTGIKRSKLHLSASYADDIDFIDTIQETDCYEVRHSITSNTQKSGFAGRGHNKFSRSNTPRKLSSDQNANKASSIGGVGGSTGGGGGGGGSGIGGMRSRKNSRTSISNLSGVTATASSSSTTKGATYRTKSAENHNKSTTIVVSMVSSTKSNQNQATATKKANTDLSNNSNPKTDVETTTIKTATNIIGENGATTEIGEITSSSTTKLLENTTERLLREAVSSQAATITDEYKAALIISSDAIAGVNDWKMETDYAYGISVSLYENNMLTKEPMGSPIADCYGMVVHGDAAAMALADGVNWGDGARLAARSAVHGCLDYLDRALFGLVQECMATSTHEVFVSLLRSLWEGHGCILEVGGALSTLTIAVVLPLAKITHDESEMDSSEKYVVCACNVGDSLGYIYSKKHGVREFTQASHDITSMRDMRDALGALGPADGNKPELSNLTLSMTIIEKGDIVFLTSDGVSDNFDPVVGKFAEAWTPDVKLMSSHGHGRGGILAPKRQNKSASALYARLHHTKNGDSQQQKSQQSPQQHQQQQPPVRPPRSKKSASPENLHSASSSVGVTTAPSRPKYMRSHTVIEPRRLSSAGNPALHHPYTPPLSAITKIPKSISGLPLVTGPQRHALTLYRLEDLLSYGINGTFSPCVSARRLCHLLIDFVRMITSARRKTLEQRELFYKLATGPDGIKREVEMNRMQHRAARKRVVDSSAFVALPGKLDHATVVAYTVGGDSGSSPGDSVLAPLQSKEFQETNF